MPALAAKKLDLCSTQCDLRTLSSFWVEMKSVRRTDPSDRRPEAKLGTFIGLSALAVVPLAAGVAMLTIRHLSLRDLQAAKSWVETPCVVESCDYDRQEDGDAGRYLDFVYRYEVDGHEYRGDRLDPIIGRMGDDDVFEDFVHESYPPGARATCYVDPEGPSTSVFDRDHGADAPRRMWLLAFPFTCVGLGFGLALAITFIGGRRSVKTESSAEPSELTSRPGAPPRDLPWLTRAVVLAGPASSQMAWLFVVGFIYVFIILDGPASYARLFDLWPAETTAVGRVTDARELDEREMYVSIYQYTIQYEVDGQAYTSDSYTRGKRYEEGDEVAVTYDPAIPDEGTIAGTRPSNFTWWHSAIPLGVLLLLAVGLVGMYVHNLRVLGLLRRGQVTRARWQEPPPSDPEDREDPGQIASMFSDFHFEIAGRSYRAKKYSPGTKFRRRPSASAPDPADELVVLYNADKPAHNIILNGALADLIDGCRSVWDHLLHCIPGPLVVVVLVVLLRGAELI
ncbi:MAG: DUF3592 domain-containing protein [bacterium]|nr:DUF3592 domain-containing protein [bacterium]